MNPYDDTPDAPGNQTELEVIGTLTIHLRDHMLGGNAHLPWARAVTACDLTVKQEEVVSPHEASINPSQITCRRCRAAWVDRQLTNVWRCEACNGGGVKHTGATCHVCHGTGRLNR